MTSTGLQDPRRLHPAPPFPKQQQPSPGLESKMSPVPDDGADSYRGAGRLTGRRALITGGDSGIGRAVAIAFAREGADVAIRSLPAEQSDAESVRDLIEAAGRRAVLLPGDDTDEASCTALVEDAVAALGGLDVLVNNAAAQADQPDFTAITTEQFDRAMKTNVYGLFWITRAAIPHLPPGAAIINTTSVQAYRPSQGIVDYAMTKAAIVACTKALAPQLIERGVRINAVAPGPVWTPLQSAGGTTEQQLEQFGAQVPLGRPGQPSEIAPVSVLLASNDASCITGEVYGVTGGVGIA